jgi:hypothetical protein
MVPDIVTSLPISFAEGLSRGYFRKWNESGSRKRGHTPCFRAALGIDRPARDRTARCWLHWRRRGSSRLDPVIPGSAARSRVEVRPSAHDRGGAPKGERAAPGSAPMRDRDECSARRIRWQAFFFCGGAETSGAPTGAPPPFFVGEARRAFLKREAKLGCEGASRERGSLLVSPHPEAAAAGGPRRMLLKRRGRRPSRLAPLAPQDDGHDACVASLSAPPPSRARNDIPDRIEMGISPPHT